MKRITKIMIALAGLFGAAVQFLSDSSVQQAIAGYLLPILRAHPKLSALATSIAAILALAHNPQERG
jgi:hypothetical protein